MAEQMIILGMILVLAVSMAGEWAAEALSRWHKQRVPRVSIKRRSGAFHLLPRLDTSCTLRKHSA